MAPEPEAHPATTSHQVASGQLHKVFETVTDLPGLTEAERLQKRQIVAGIVMAIQPRDPLEMMLAGQCIIFDHLLYQAVQALSPNQPEPAKRDSRPGVVATARMFHNSLNALRRLRNPTRDRTSRPRPVPQEPEARTAVAEPEARTAVAEPAATDPAATQPLASRRAPVPRPRFVCERVHLPRRQEAADTVRFGAAYRPSPPRIRNQSSTNRSQLLNTVSRIAMPIPAEARQALSIDELPCFLRAETSAALQPKTSREKPGAKPVPRKRR